MRSVTDRAIAVAPAQLGARWPVGLLGRHNVAERPAAAAAMRWRTGSVANQYYNTAMPISH